MNILFCSPAHKPEPWIEGLRDALPRANIAVWTPGHATKADYAVVWSPPQQFIDEQPQLKAVFNMGAGVDALLTLRTPPGMQIVRLDDAGMAVQMAEFVCHAVTRHFRELDACEAEIRAGKWSFRKPLLRAHFPVGILGMGVLGSRVAQALRGFDYAVNGWSRSAKAADGVRMFAGDAQLAEFLAASRVLVCLLPLTAATQNILNRNTLAQLRPGGYVINVARGAHLVDEDLIEALNSGQLAGAALDVFRTEPLPAEHPFWKHPKITLTPHTSARTLREETIAQIAAKMEALQSGQPIAGVVDLQRGY